MEAFIFWLWQTAMRVYMKEGLTQSHKKKHEVPVEHVEIIITNIYLHATW